MIDGDFLVADAAQWRSEALTAVCREVESKYPEYAVLIAIEV